MKILFIGSGYINSTAMQLSHVIAGEPECEKAGFIDTFRHVLTHLNEDGKAFEKYYDRKEVIEFSYFFKKFPFLITDLFDVIFIEQNGFLFHNDVGIDTIYYHRDIPDSIFMKNMDILLYRFKEQEHTIARDTPKVWNNGVMKRRYLNGVNVSSFDSTKTKIHKGINWIGWSHSFEYYWEKPNQKEYYLHVRYLVNWARRHGLIKYHEHGLLYPQYKNILERSEAVLIIPGKKAYVTRKIYEAMSCKTVVVLHVQNEEANQLYKEMGLIHGKNCLKFHSKEELRKIKKKFRTYDKKLITQHAYNWVKNNHTWDNRAKELLQIIKKFQRNKKHKKINRGVKNTKF